MTEEQTRLFGIEKLKVRALIPAVTHMDYSARIQTVHAETTRSSTASCSALKSAPAARCW